MTATTAEKKDTDKRTVRPRGSEMLSRIVELVKYKEGIDGRKIQLATNNDSRGPSPSARK